MFVYLSRDPSNTFLKSPLPVRTRWLPATRWVRVTRKAYTTFTSTPEFKFPPWYANLRHYGQLDEVVAYSLWLWWLLCDYVQLLLVIMCNATCLCVPTDGAGVRRDPPPLSLRGPTGAPRPGPHAQVPHSSLARPGLQMYHYLVSLGCLGESGFVWVGLGCSLVLWCGVVWCNVVWCGVVGWGVGIVLV